MNENGIQNYKTLQEQLDDLKREQAEAEKIYRGRIELGALNRDSASVQVLAQTILDRKMQIEDLEAQIGSTALDNKDYLEEMQENTQEYQETSLTKYHRNPIINWLQRMVLKIEQKLENMEQRNAQRGSRIPTEPKMYQSKYEEYQEIIDTDFSKNSHQQKHEKKSWKLSPEQLKQVREATEKIAEKYRHNSTIVQTPNKEVSQR